MLRRISPILLISILLTGCGGNSNSKMQSIIENKKSTITIYVPRDVRLDPKYYEDKEIAINYLPDKTSYTKSDVDEIVNNIDKHVKVLIISTDKSGLEPVFDKVKKKIPGVVTVAGDIGEMRNSELYKVLKNPSINVSFMVEKNYNGVISAKMAEIMKAKRFLYLYNKGQKDVLVDIDRTRSYLNKLGIEFVPVEISKENFNQAYVDEVIEKKSKNEYSSLAVYPADSSLSKYVLNLCKDKKFIIPNLNSDNDGLLMSKEFGLEDEYKTDSREVFEKKLSEKLKVLGLNNRIAGISEGRESIPAEISIEVSKYMYEKNYMIEECYEDRSLVDRGNRNLDLLLLPENISESNSYSRNILLYPRIY